MSSTEGAASTTFDPIGNLVGKIERVGLKIAPDEIARLINLPDQFEIGMAVGDGEDCFLASLSRALNNLNNTDAFSEKYLRQLCFEYYQKNTKKMDEINEAEIENGGMESPKDYWAIQYTAEEMNADFHGRPPIRGRYRVEGLILAEALNTPFFVVEVLERTGTYNLRYHLLNNWNCQLMEGPLNYALDIPFIILSGSHFVPVIPKQIKSKQVQLSSNHHPLDSSWNPTFPDDSDEGFIEIGPPIRIHERTSALYYLLEIGLGYLPDDCSFIKLRIDKNGNPYYHLELKNPPIKVIYPESEYKFSGHHLRIDPHYSQYSDGTARKGISYAHYTLIYTHRTTGVEITIHAYFNNFGQYLYSEIKEEIPPPPKKEVASSSEGGVTSSPQEEIASSLLPTQKFKKLPISPQLENLIQINSTAAGDLLNNIIFEKNTRREQIYTELQALEKNLKKYSSDFSVLENRANYIREREQYLEKLETLNRYNELPETYKTKPVKEMIKNLKNYQTPTQQPKTPLSENKTELAKPTPIAEPKPIKKTSIIATPAPAIFLPKINGLIEQLSQRANTQINNASFLIETHALVDELQDTQLEWMFSSEYPEDPETQRQTIDAVEQAIQKVQTFEEYFKDCLDNENLDELKLIFPFVAHINFGPVYTNIFRSKAMIGVFSKELIRIFDFLFENSENYKPYISLLSCIPISNADHSRLYSFLATASAFNNFDLFHMYLRHGFDPNRRAMYRDNIHCNHLQFLIMTKHDPKYIKLLLKYGASIDRARLVDAIPSKQFIEMQENSIDLPIELSILTKSPSDLYLTIEMQIYPLIPLLLKHSRLFSVAIALGRISCMPSVIKRFLPNPNTSGLCCVSSQLECNEEAIRRTEIAVPNKMSFILGSEDPFIFDIIKEICIRFQAQCQNLDFIQLKEVIDELNAFQKSFNKSPEDIQYRMSVFIACQFLLYEQETLSESQTEILIWTFHQTFLLHASKNRYDKNSFACATAVFENSSFKNTLKAYQKFSQDHDKIARTFAPAPAPPENLPAYVNTLNKTPPLQSRDLEHLPPPENPKKSRTKKLN